MHVQHHIQQRSWDMYRLSILPNAANTCLLQLKEELGATKMAKLEPPSKNRLGSVNKRPDLVEKRRRELESWLWKLIGDGEIARSQVLNKFLELSDAARLVQRLTGNSASVQIILH